MKKLKIKKPAAHDTKGYGDEPSWTEDISSLDASEYVRQTMAAVNWYYQFYTKKDGQEWFQHWYSVHFPKRKADLKYIAAAKPDVFLNITAFMAAMEQNGWQARLPILRAVVKNIKAIIQSGKERKNQTDADTKAAEAAPSGPVVSIQDRLREAAGKMSEDIDLAIDNYILDADAFDPKSFKVVNMLRGVGAKPAHARIIRAFYERQLAEYEELASPDCDPQLIEAHEHYGKKNIKKMHDFLISVVSACDQIIGEAKLTKRPTKAKPVEDLVKKLKFCKGDDKLGVTSAPPAQLIGASAVAVYNVRTRKIGYYVAVNTNGLGVKGTSLTNFTDKSTQKTLRKPLEQIKEFKDQNTQKRFETWYAKEVKTTETVLTGRFNEDTIILKVFK